MAKPLISPGTGPTVELEAAPAHSLPLRKLLDKNSPADYQAYLARLRQWLRAQRAR